MHGRLTVCFADRPARVFALRPGGAFVLGRDAACDFQLDDPRLSRRHVAFTFSTDQWRCEDLGSKNGVRANGRVVQRCVLEPGMWLDFGGLLARFDVANEAQAAARRAGHAASLNRLGTEHGAAALLENLLDSVLALANMQRAFVMLGDGAGDFEIVATRAFRDGDFRAAGFSGSLSAVREALATGRAVVGCDLAGLTRFADRPSVVAGGIRALACLPLRSGERPADGVVYADSSTPGAILDELDLEILQELAAQAALALAAVAVREELERLAGELPTSRSLRTARAGVQESASQARPTPAQLTLGELLRAHGVDNGGAG